MRGNVDASKDRSAAQPTTSREPSPAPSGVSTPDAASESAQPAEPVSTGPRSTAPERRGDLSALREVANEAAQRALNRHEHYVLKSASYSKLAIAIASLVMGGGLLWMWGQYGIRQMFLFAAVVAFFVGAYWGAEWIGLAYHMIADKSRRGHSTPAMPEPPSDEEAP